MSSMDPEYSPDERKIQALDRIAETLEMLHDIALEALLDHHPDKSEQNSLGSSVPPGSESARRSSDKPPFTSRADSTIPERGKWRVGSKVPLNVYDGDRAVCQCHSELDAQLIVRAMNRQRVGGPPTPDLAAQPDYNSLVACLRTNFHMVFTTYAEEGDPQDMIQLMAAEIQYLRRKQDA